MKEMLMSLALSISTIAVAAPKQEKIDDLWPLCAGWQTTLEEWQWITPAELSAEKVIDAVKGLSSVEGKSVDGEVGDIFSMNLKILEGYRLMVLAKQDVSIWPKDSIGVIRHRKAVSDFCKWITTNSFPE